MSTIAPPRPPQSPPIAPTPPTPPVAPSPRPAQPTERTRLAWDWTLTLDPIFAWLRGANPGRVVTASAVNHCVVAAALTDLFPNVAIVTEEEKSTLWSPSTACRIEHSPRLCRFIQRFDDHFDLCSVNLGAVRDWAFTPGALAGIAPWADERGAARERDTP